MNKYKIEHRIFTLSPCAVLSKQPTIPPGFEVENIKFSHWDFNWIDGWPGHYWLATATVEAENYKDAFASFADRLVRITSRISLIGQSYIAAQIEPYLIHRTGHEAAFFYYTKDIEVGGLMITEPEHRALNLLLKADIVNEFYYYWNDAINTHSYTSKLLLMFAAIECLASHRDKSKFKKYPFFEHVLGVDLAKDIFEDSKGLRHRLSHGQYFSEADGARDYVELIHKRVMKFFNEEIIGEGLLAEDVVNPQRHAFGNKEQFVSFIKFKSEETGKEYVLEEAVNDFDTNGLNAPKEFEIIRSNEVPGDY